MHLSQKFLNTIKSEFDEFKNQLQEQGVPTEKFTAVLKDDKLKIHIPNPKYYDAFIKHLENKNLLPVPNLEREHSLKSTTEYIRAFSPTPFATRPEKK